MDKNKKNVMITGATGAIGLAIARQLAFEGNYNVILVVRNISKAQKATASIMKDTGNQDIEHRIADLSIKREIIALSESFQYPLHVLINNAATTPIQRQETPDGIELQWATNVLGYFWMMTYFQKHLASTTGRIVNVASYWAGGLDLHDPEFKYRSYNNDSAYRQTKQADRMLTVAFSQKFQKDGISVNACHPGDVNSALSNNLGFGGSQSPDQGAETPVWLATNETGGEVTGKYFERMRQINCRFGTDKDAVQQLYQICSDY